VSRVAGADVAIIMGSQSDWPTMRHAADRLDELGVRYEARIASAHRTPDRVVAFAKGAQAAGYKIIVAGAGGAAALPGMIAALTALPVLGVPIETGALKGQDSLFSIVQMPAGAPVGALAIGKAGASNAGLLAAAILALADEGLAARLAAWRAAQSAAVAERPVEEELGLQGSEIRVRQSDELRRTKIIAIDHVQLAMPAGREAEARAFYSGVLGMREVGKPRIWPIEEGAGSRRARQGSISAWKRRSARPAKPILLSSCRISPGCPTDSTWQAALCGQTGRLRATPAPMSTTRSGIGSSSCNPTSPWMTKRSLLRMLIIVHDAALRGCPPG